MNFIIPKTKPAPAKFKIGDQVKRHCPSSDILAAEIGIVATIPSIYKGRRVAVVWMRADGTGYRRCYELAYLDHAGGETVKIKTIIAAEILDFWCAQYDTTLARIAAEYEVTHAALSMLKTGVRDLDRAGRELRNSFLNVALRMPEKQRSVELDDWIERTEKYFQEKPLCGKFL